MIDEIHGTYFLVAVVDDDFIHGDIFRFFEACLQASKANASASGESML